MNVAIRTDASIEIGTGHVMRCVTLAKQLTKEGAKVTFICRDFPGNCISFIQSEGFSVHILPSSVKQNHWQWVKGNWKQDAVESKNVLNSSNSNIDLLIIDHYSIDIKWECELRSVVKHIMVIDDLADRYHDCELLLDQNYYLDIKDRYKGLVPDYCTLLLGPNYVLLRDEFLSINTENIKRNGQINNVLVFFGGSDPTGETMKTLQALQELNYLDIKFNVVVGSANPHKENIKQISKLMSNVNFYCQVNNMAELMVKADLAIGAGGSATWERCFLQLPSLVYIIADNQQEVINATAHKGAVISLGEAAEITKLTIKNALNFLIYHPKRVKEISECCREVVNPLIIREKSVCKEIFRIVNRGRIRKIGGINL